MAQHPHGIPMAHPGQVLLVRDVALWPLPAVLLGQAQQIVQGQRLGPLDGQIHLALGNASWKNGENISENSKNVGKCRIYIDTYIETIEQMMLNPGLILAQRCPCSLLLLLSSYNIIYFHTFIIHQVYSYTAPPRWKTLPFSTPRCSSGPNVLSHDAHGAGHREDHRIEVLLSWGRRTDATIWSDSMGDSREFGNRIPGWSNFSKETAGWLWLTVCHGKPPCY